nr:MAG TPA: hypothetical protein [Caudoviricetes sp.]
MNLDFSNLSSIEMSVSIREIYDRCVYAMGYSAIDLCYNDINGEFYDSKKQYFPFTVEEIIEYIFITMMIDKRSLEVSQMPLTDEVLGHYINYSGYTVIESFAQQMDVIISELIEDDDLREECGMLVNKDGVEIEISASTPVEIIDFIAYFLYFFNQYFYASFPELSNYIIENDKGNMSIVVSSVATYTDIFYRQNNPSPILGNILENNMLCNIYFDFDNGELYSLKTGLNDFRVSSNDIVQSGDISWQNI